MKDKAANVAGDIGKSDFSLGAGKAHGPELHSQAALLIGEVVPDRRACLQHRGAAEAAGIGLSMGSLQ
jgi:hypothetical protein